MTYRPLYVRGMTTGLVQSREEFILPADAYPVLENAFVWRERIKRKQAYELLGRLRRILTAISIGNISSAGAGVVVVNIFTQLIAGGFVQPSETDATIEVGSITPITIVIGAPISQTLTDTTGNGVLNIAPAGVITSATINYATGDLSLTFSGAAGASAATFAGAYYPNLPVMGLRQRELNNINNEMLVAFDQVYAYIFTNGFQEFIPGTIWSGTDSDFFWSTNYFVGDLNLKIFWVTNFDGQTGEPIRYTNGVAWVDFTPQINAAGDVLAQSLAILPFRGRLMVFNTLEGATLGTSVAFPQRIRWAAIGNPFTVIVPGVVSTVNPNAWRDDIRGQGGFLDIPTSESIVAVGFVRDNLVIYCERSTWQLRYTGRTIAPFQIEKVNSEFGSESTFSALQFDTSLVGVGDKGIIECDSYKSERIDIKIPDLVFNFNNNFNGTKRVHGVRDFFQRLAFWTYPFADTNPIFPNRRLVYNYENDSWAIFTDSLTTLGTFQPQSSLRWQDVPYAWETQNVPWLNRPALFPSIIGGNQQGFVEYLDSATTNDVSLFIQNITGNTTTPTVVTSPNHNLETGYVIMISDIPAGSPFATSLNAHIFGVVVININDFQLWVYNPATDEFDIPQLDPPGVYIGAGLIRIRDNFRVVSKKFNFLEEGQNIQLGFIDVLVDDTEDGAMSMYCYLNYNDSEPINKLPQNIDPQTNSPDTFFNSVVTTSSNDPTGLKSNKNWKRVFCNARGQFITIEWTLSNGQLVGTEQENDVQIDTQIIWLRKAGRQLPQSI